jgi:hypothetical protein
MTDNELKLIKQIEYLQCCLHWAGNILVKNDIACDYRGMARAQMNTRKLIETIAGADHKTSEPIVDANSKFLAEQVETKGLQVKDD